ncbi:MAG: Ni/Fe-hydrogenase, b-type cytochrome subunit [Desulfuromonadaceae bacterium]
MIEIRYVWEWPVRVTHWVNVLSILVLSVTGFYIGDPFVSVPSSSAYVMGWMRFIHLVFAYVFTISVLSRLLWACFANRHASWRAFFPLLFKEGREGAWQMFRYYTFTSPKITYEVGHNALAATAYSGVMVLYLVQIITGFALYGLFAPAGLMNGLFAPLNALVGLQWVRLIHHLIMWLLIGFSIHHVYSAWLMDIKERNGTMSSIFGGCKFIEPEDL